MLPSISWYLWLVQFLSSLSLSLLDTKIFLGALQHWIKESKGRTKKEKGSKDQARKSKIKRLQQVLGAGTDLHVCFPH